MSAHGVDLFRVRQVALPAMAVIAVQNNSDMSRHRLRPDARRFDRARPAHATALLASQPFDVELFCRAVPRLMSSDLHSPAKHQPAIRMLSR